MLRRIPLVQKVVDGCIAILANIVFSKRKLPVQAIYRSRMSPGEFDFDQTVVFDTGIRVSCSTF